MIFETHAHYDDEAFAEDRTTLLAGMKEHGIGTIVNIAADLESCKTTLELSGKYPFVYAALGVHPSGTEELSEESLKWIADLCREHDLRKGGKVVAVGEIGLDYHWEEPGQDIQRHWFEKQLEMAREVSLPLVIHSRDAAKETYDIMKAHNAGELGGIIHCYSYSRELSRDFLEMGFSFGIGGVVTFSNARKLKETVEYLPIENIVLETDSPYLAPVPFRGKRNSSLNLIYVAEEIGRIKNMETEKVIEITERNAKKLFRLEGDSYACLRKSQGNHGDTGKVSF